MRAVFVFDGGSTYYDATDLDGIKNFIAHLIQCGKTFRVEYRTT